MLLLGIFNVCVFMYNYNYSELSRMFAVLGKVQITSGDPLLRYNMIIFWCKSKKIKNKNKARGESDMYCTIEGNMYGEVNEATKEVLSVGVHT